MLEAKGARIGLITTAGFKDVLEIGRQMRHAMYDLILKPETPVFLAPGALRKEVRERVAADGAVLVPLDEASVERAAREPVGAIRQQHEAHEVGHQRSQDDRDEQGRQLVERRSKEERQEVRDHQDRPEGGPAWATRADRDRDEQDEQEHDVAEQAASGDERRQCGADRTGDRHQ